MISNLKIIQFWWTSQFAHQKEILSYFHQEIRSIWLNFQNLISVIIRKNKVFIKNKANYLKITLNEMDTYTVEFQKVNYSKFTVNDVAAFENVYCDQLQKVFTSITGMYTKL